jgi:hypothetical protein
MGEVGRREQRAGRLGSCTHADVGLGRCDWIEAGRRRCIDGLTKKMRDGGWRPIDGELGIRVLSSLYTLDGGPTG